MHELAKAYDPGAIEQRWAEKWVQERLFEVKTPAEGAKVEVIVVLHEQPDGDKAVDEAGDMGRPGDRLPAGTDEARRARESPGQRPFGRYLQCTTGV